MRVSVVIPTFHRFELLKRCLKALIYQDFPADEYEIIVVDDGGNQGLQHLEELEGLREGLQIIYTPVIGKSHGPAVARNQGWNMSRGKIIAFTDDDTIPDLSWIREGVNAFRPGVLAVAGKVIVPLSKCPTD